MDKVNPESIVNASIAAMSAHQAAGQAFIISLVLVGITLLILIGVVMILVKVDRVEKHTNSMKDQLVLATRKIGLMEGEAVGRQAAHDEGKSGRKQRKGETTVIEKPDPKPAPAPKPDPDDEK